jgi:hypothetical protein
MRDVDITVTNKSSVVWSGELRGEAFRIVDVGNSCAIAERLTGHDAMGNERWETVATKQALDEVRRILPEGVTLGKKEPTRKLPYGLVVLPKGLTFRDLTRLNEDGDRALLLTFPADFENGDGNTDAIELALNGRRGKIVLDGHYERGAFYVHAAQHYSEEEAPVVEGHGCAQVTAALRRHLERGDPEERFSLPGRSVRGSSSVTARKLLELLEAGDERALGFVQDVHNAALRSIRQRHRKPSQRPNW